MDLTTRTILNTSPHRYFSMQNVIFIGIQYTYNTVLPCVNSGEKREKRVEGKGLKMFKILKYLTQLI